MLGYLANTLIFTITGVEAVSRSLAQRRENLRFDHLAVVYGTCTVVRACLLFGAIPLFKVPTCPPTYPPANSCNCFNLA